MWQRQTDPAFFNALSGPYRLGQFEISRYLTLKANPAYSGPQPHIARIVVNFLDGTSKLRVLQSGEADAASGDEASFAFQDYTAEQVPVIFMPQGIYAVLARDGVEGISKFVSPMNTWAPESLRLTGPMACNDADDHQPS